ncbi:phosphotransferase [Legionella bozemanae]|uniref:Spectinomycin phosphotransferase n=1 Tax=Legionella bozemanae TaxID=447 RepID=A0A0W0RJ86_LEGBO|nr:phosphotransferase [Legionella bozemanae]KTC71152.1 spectinomycin phosphotransferase [Legionella bozemanae]STO33287.1 serine/threonine protein kinase [Legionella bozemanae]
MFEKPSLTHQKIIEHLKIDYHIDTLTLTHLSIGADINASLYKADTKNQSYFVKLKKGSHHEVAIDVLDLLRKKGIQQIIKPINTTANQPILYADEFSLIVYPFIHGQNGFNQTLTKEQWITLGKTLKQIHEIDVPQLIQHQLRHELYTSKWREYVGTLWEHIEKSSALDEYALKLITFVKKNHAVIVHLVERAEHLVQKIQNTSHQLVLCHSDIHAGNILISPHHSIYIVDWDEPIMAPKERDLMFIGGGIANVWNEPYQETLFYKGYGKTEINKALLAYYRCERIVEDIAVYTQEILSVSSEYGNKAQSYEHFISMFATNGVVDIALNTAEI